MHLRQYLFSSNSAALLLVLGVWLLARPHFGITHDAIFYLAQANQLLQPDLYTQDLFFVFGSQSDYSLFPYVEAFFIRYLGAFYGTTLMYWTALAGLVYVLSRLLKEWNLERNAALFVLVSVAYVVHEIWIFSFGEWIVTARLYSQLAGMIGLYLLTRGLGVASILAFLVSLTFHPVMAVWLIGVAIYIQLGIRRSSVLVLAGLALLALAMVFASSWLDPYRISPEFREFILARNGPAVIEGWPVARLYRAGYAIATCLLCACMVKGIFRRTLVGAAVAGVLSLGLLAWLTGYENLLLAIQIQFGRGLWVPYFFSSIAMGYFIFVSFDKYRSLSIVLLIFVSWVSRESWPGLLAMSFLATIFCSDRAYLKLKGYLPLVGIGCAGILWLHFGVYYPIPIMATIYEPDFIDYFWHYFGVGTIFVFLIMAVAYSSWLPNVQEYLSGRQGIAIISIFSIFILSLGVIKSHPFGSERFIFEKLALKENWGDQLGIPREATIFWEQDTGNGSRELAYIWFGLQRSSYYSWHQMAGGLFNEQTMLEGMRRRALIEGLGIHTYDWEVTKTGVTYDSFPTDPISSQQAQGLCDIAAVDYLVMFQNYPEYAPILVEQVPSDIDHYLYNCETLKYYETSL